VQSRIAVREKRLVESRVVDPLRAVHSISELMVPSDPYVPVLKQVLPVLKGKVLGHASEASQTQLVPVLFLQHAMPASACWTANNSSVAKATTAKGNIESNLVNDRLLGNR
jgi:hypothetical protein